MTPRAPSFRSVDALTGEVASPVLGILATADHIHTAVADAERLRDENAELQIRVNELEEELGIWRDEVHRLRSELATAQQARDTYRAALAVTAC